MMLLLAAMLSATTTLAVPGRANATPSIAAQGRLIIVVWSASLPTGSTDVFAAVSRDGARTFGAPVRVNHVEGDARVSGEQPPRATLVPQRTGAPAILVVWTTKGPNGTRIVEARSDDEGRTFAPAAPIAGGDAAGNRGWESITIAGPQVDALWLDHRAMTAHDGHMSPEQSSLYFGPVDGSRPPRPLTSSVCYCCKTALVAAMAGQQVYAAWRHVYPGNIRDIAFTMSRDGGRTFAAPVRVSSDGWILEGCPDDGPAMAVDGSGRIHIVWPTLVGQNTDDPSIALFYAASADGKTFSSRQRMPTEGQPHHPQVALERDGTPVFAWDELRSGKRRVVVGRGAPRGGNLPTTEEISEGTAAIYPAIAVGDEGAVAVWTSGGPTDSTIAVRRIGRR